MVDLRREGATSAFWLRLMGENAHARTLAKVLLHIEEDDAAILYLDMEGVSVDPPLDISGPDTRTLFAHGNPHRLAELILEHCDHLPQPTSAMVSRELREILDGATMDNLDLSWAEGGDRYLALGIPALEAGLALSHVATERPGVRGMVYSGAPFHSAKSLGVGVDALGFPRPGEEAQVERLDRQGEADRQKILNWLPRSWFHAWDFFFTDEALADVPGTDNVTSLGEQEHGEVIELLNAENPGSEGLERLAERRWYGVRDEDGQLLTVVSAIDEPFEGGLTSVHLAGLGTARAARGRGLASAVMVAATNLELQRGADVVTFGMWGGNHSARRVYSRIGFINGGRQYMLAETSEESPDFEVA